MLFYLTKSTLTQMNLAAIKGNHVNLDTETVVTLGTLVKLGTLVTLGTLATLGTQEKRETLEIAKIFLIEEVLRLIEIKVVI